MDLLPGPVARRTSRPTSDKDAGPAPYKAPKKKTEREAKETRGGLHCRSTSYTISEDFEARSSSKEDEEEEEIRVREIKWR